VLSPERSRKSEREFGGRNSGSFDTASGNFTPLQTEQGKSVAQLVKRKTGGQKGP
jgi:hypothetical protein